MREVRSFRMGWKAAVLLLVVGVTCWGCSRSEIVTFNDVDKKLYVIDKETYEMQELANLSGAFALTNPSALTFTTAARYAEDLYLHADGATPSGRALYRVNISNPASPTIVSLGDCPRCGGGMAMCKDGVLYSVYGTSQHPSALYTIDPVTLDHTLIAYLGFDTGNLGLACEPNTDELYFFSQWEDALFTLDKATGVAAPVGAPTGLNVSGGIGLEFDPLNPLNLYLAAKMADEAFHLYALDPATGAHTHLRVLPKGERNLGARVVEKEQ